MDPHLLVTSSFECVPTGPIAPAVAEQQQHEQAAPILCWRNHFLATENGCDGRVGEKRAQEEQLPLAAIHAEVVAQDDQTRRNEGPHEEGQDISADGNVCV